MCKFLNLYRLIRLKTVYITVLYSYFCLYQMKSYAIGLTLRNQSKFYAKRHESDCTYECLKTEWIDAKSKDVKIYLNEYPLLCNL